MKVNAKVVSVKSYDAKEHERLKQYRENHKWDWLNKLDKPKKKEKHKNDSFVKELLTLFAFNYFMDNNKRKRR